MEYKNKITFYTIYYCCVNLFSMHAQMKMFLSVLFIIIALSYIAIYLYVLNQLELCSCLFLVPTIKMFNLKYGF